MGRPNPRAPRRRSLLPVLLLVAGCGEVTTGVDVEIVGGEKLGGDQVRVEGGVDGELVHMSTLPSPARALARIEDVRVIVPDAMAGKTLTVVGTVLKAGQPVGAPGGMEGKAILVERRTKRIKLCFDPAGCP